jgi:uncharacterized membrane protein (DUF485 family)
MELNQENLIAVAISGIYPAFCYKLSTVLFELPNNMCAMDINSPNQAEYTECEEKRRSILFKRQMLLLVMGVVGIIVIGFAGSSIAYSTKVGIGIGSLLTILQTIVLYWGTYNEKVKLFVLGGCIVALAFAAAKLNKQF